MSQLRTALRAYAVEGLEPAEVVAKLHRLVDHLARRPEHDARLPGLRPVHARGALRQRRPPADPARARRRAVALPAGRALDTARRGAGRRADPAGAHGARAGRRRPALHRRPRRAPRRRHRQPPAAAARGRRRGAGGPADAALEHLTATLVGDETLRQDDVALLALRVTQPAGETFAAVIAPRGRASWPRCAATCARWLRAAGATASEAGDVLIAVGEACANAIEHAGAEPGSTIEVRAQLVGREVVLRICDHGQWRSAAARSERGHGLRLMRVLMDAIDIASRARRDARGAAAQAGGARGAARSTAARDGAADGTGGGDAPRARALRSAATARGDRWRAWRARSTSSRRPPRPRARARDAGRRPRARARPQRRRLSRQRRAALLHDTSRTLAARGQSLRVVVARDAEIARLLEIVGIGADGAGRRVGRRGGRGAGGAAAALDTAVASAYHRWNDGSRYRTRS